MELHARLARRVVSDGECWRWTGARRPNGYGMLMVGSRRDGSRRIVSAHRLAYELMVGPIPAGRFVLHRCDVRDCVRPSHLFLGDALDNAQDRDAKGRNADVRGECNGASRLTATQVMAIRWLVAEGLKHSAVATAFGVPRQLVSRVAIGERWSHLPVFPYTPQRGGSLRRSGGR